MISRLPRPDDDSLAHCKKVRKFIRQAIDEAGGSISFAQFMHLALYAPGLGYYNVGTTKFGATGDWCRQWPPRRRNPAKVD
jgi:hypothetical protein